MNRLRPLSEKRRGVAIVMIGILLPVLLGMLVLTIDVGAIFNTKADLQNAADAAALSATGVLATNRGSAGVAIARETAAAIVQRHHTLGRHLKIDPNVDVVFGQVEFDPINNEFSFTPTEVMPDAVRVTVRRTADSPNGPAPLYFAGIFGDSTANISASAAAALTGARDMAVTIDLSGSMKHDSYLRFYDKTQINARDVWASLDGPAPSKPYIPGEEHETEYAGDSGPTMA